MLDLSSKSKLKELKHELVNSLAALRSVHTALNEKNNVEDADRLLISVIDKLDKLKKEISKEEEEINE